MASVSVGDESDSPIAINVTPLVDILFCLCVFFMISFKFEQLEGRFDAWLPHVTGSDSGPSEIIDAIANVRLALFWDETASRTERKLGTRRIADDDELARLLAEARDDCLRMNKPDPSVTIDADARVPWRDVVGVMNLCKKSRLDRIEFALAAPPAGTR